MSPLRPSFEKYMFPRKKGFVSFVFERGKDICYWFLKKCAPLRIKVQMGMSFLFKHFFFSKASF